MGSQGAPDLDAPAAHPLKVLVATDGSPCSDRAVQSVTMRPWPTDSQIEVVSVVYTRMPSFPDPQLMIEAAHIEALEADRQRAPGRVLRAERCLAGKPGVSVTTKVLEGGQLRRFSTNLNGGMPISSSLAPTDTSGEAAAPGFSLAVAQLFAVGAPLPTAFICCPQQISECAV